MFASSLDASGRLPVPKSGRGYHLGDTSFCWSGQDWCQSEVAASAAKLLDTRRVSRSPPGSPPEVGQTVAVPALCRTLTAWQGHPGGLIRPNFSGRPGRLQDSILAPIFGHMGNYPIMGYTPRYEPVVGQWPGPYPYANFGGWVCLISGPHPSTAMCPRAVARFRGIPLAANLWGNSSRFEDYPPHARCDLGSGHDLLLCNTTASYPGR